jgi:dihydrofolate synthase/folylpolyglutamate synthase
MKVTDISSRKNHDTDPRLRFNTLPEWLSWQERLHFTAIELGLDRCRKVAEIMDLLPPSYYVISIAGTNGKGSTAVMLENILRAAGYKVGIYTSPHLLRYNERIRVNGVEAGDRALCVSFNKIDQARGSISLTYFEFGTLAAMDIFRENGIDIAIMEVGMGGRLDAVNMLDANVAVISTIDIDHEQWLGYDRNSIGREKSGIFRSMRPAICADPDPPASVMETAVLVGAKLLRSGHEFSFEFTGDGWSWRSGLARYDRLPVPGRHHYQIQNAAGVLMALQAVADYFPVSEAVLYQALHDFRMPGRFQVVPGEVPLILDVAHNRQSAAMLARNIKAIAGTGRTLVVLGMLKDKNHAAFINELLGCVDVWYLAALGSTRGGTSGELADILRRTATEVEMYEYTAPAEAVSAARAAARPGDRVLVTGSFMTVGLAIEFLGLGV